MRYRLVYEMESDDIELVESIYGLLWTQACEFDELQSAYMESVVNE